jgi:hypothetical protein
MNRFIYFVTASQMDITERVIENSVRNENVLIMSSHK